MSIVRRRPCVNVNTGGGDEGAGCGSSAACSHASQRGFWVRPAKGLGSLARVLTGLANGNVVWSGADRPLSHAHHTSMPSHRQASINSASESGSCPILSPSGGDGREIYHSRMRFGNYPFVGGTRPLQLIFMGCP